MKLNPVEELQPFDIALCQMRSQPINSNIDITGAVTTAISMKAEIAPNIPNILDAWIKTPEAKSEGVLGWSKNPAGGYSLLINANPSALGIVDCDLKKFIQYACFDWPTS